MQLPSIRVMTGADVDRTADAMLREGWGDRRVKMRFVAEHPRCAPFIAEADGAIVGTGVATFNGSVAWIGTIWVDPAWRRGEDRHHLLAAFAAPDSTLCLDRPDGSLGGFVVRAPWGGGATIAPDPDDAMAIL
jgi:hypothetical protein